MKTKLSKNQKLILTVFTVLILTLLNTIGILKEKGIIKKFVLQFDTTI